MTKTLMDKVYAALEEISRKQGKLYEQTARPRPWPSKAKGRSPKTATYPKGRTLWGELGEIPPPPILSKP